jgi:hypothetical protein
LIRTHPVYSRVQYTDEWQESQGMRKQMYIIDGIQLDGIKQNYLANKTIRAVGIKYSVRY